MRLARQRKKARL